MVRKGLVSSTWEPLSATGPRLKYAARRAACFAISGNLLRLYSPRSRRIHDVTCKRSIAIVSLVPYLGDLILSLPLVDALRTEHPDERISYVCTPSVSSFLQNYPGIDEVIVLPEPTRGWVDDVPIARTYHRFIAAAGSARLLRRSRSFDVALIPRGGADPFLSAHAAWLMDIPEIYGYSSRLEPERRWMQYEAEPLMTRAVEHKRHLHESMRALEVAEIAGLIRSDCWSDDRPAGGLKMLARTQNFERITEIAGLDGKEAFAVIAPGAGHERRKWPASRFREIADHLRREMALTVLVTGALSEQELAEEVCQGLYPKVRNLAGKVNLLELVGLISRASLFIGNDSGAGHIAGALGVPTVSLNCYAATAPVNHHQSPARNKPIGPHVTIIQPQTFVPPCESECLSPTLHCLGQIETGAVWEAILKAAKASNCQE